MLPVFFMFANVSSYVGARYLIFISLLIHMCADHFYFFYYTPFMFFAHFPIGSFVFFHFICRSIFTPGIVSLCYVKFKYFLPHSHLSFDLICNVFCYTEVNIFSCNQIFLFFPSQLLITTVVSITQWFSYHTLDLGVRGRRESGGG